MNEYVSHTSIEVAHIPFDREFHQAEVVQSALIAAEMVRHCLSQAEVCSTAILIDDKHVERPLTFKDVWPILHVVTQHLPNIDYICFESRLHLYKYQLFHAIAAPHRDKVRSHIERYEMKHGNIACSHDIAIWHLMRLGIIKEVDSQTLFPAGALQNRKKPIPFVAHRLVSVLAKRDAPQETRADDEILRYCIDASVVSRIERVYFDPEVDTNTDKLEE